jgi:hypothetical protein
MSGGTRRSGRETRGGSTKAAPGGGEERGGRHRGAGRVAERPAARAEGTEVSFRAEPSSMQGRCHVFFSSFVVGSVRRLAPRKQKGPGGASLPGLRVETSWRELGTERDERGATARAGSPPGPGTTAAGRGHHRHALVDAGVVLQCQEDSPSRPRPRTVTIQRPGASSAAMMRRSVVFPEPDGSRGARRRHLEAHVVQGEEGAKAFADRGPDAHRRSGGERRRDHEVSS